MHRIRCYTLFNITHTGVLNRSKPNELDVQNWIKKRNTQCNFDTVLQIISLRSQPEVIKLPIKIEITEEHLEKFGISYDFNESTYCWRFDFEVQHSSVFNDGLNIFGYLYKDCEGVPMITDEEQCPFCPQLLNTSVELKNIYFEVL